MNLKLLLKITLFILFFINLNLSKLHSQCTVTSTVTWNSYPPCGPDWGITVESGGHLTINFALNNIYAGGIDVKDGGILIVNNNINNILGGVYARYGGEIYVNNSTLSIPGSQTGIIVRQGGKLFLDGATVIFNGGTSYPGASNQGIECIGTYSDQFDGNGNPIKVPLGEQFDVFPDPNVFNDNSKWDGELNPDQSLVVVKNSNIKFGEWGVKSTYGGIIRVSDGSVIEDCEVAIDIGTWHSASYPQTNACYFMNSTFKWGDYYSCYNFLMKLNNVNGINIGGCTFTTTYTGAQCDRGTGIFSYLSTYAVSQGGNSFCEGTAAQISANVTPKCLTNCMLSGSTNGCVFSNLDTAISFIGDQNNMEKGTLNVRFSTFTNNLLGIVAQYGRNFRIDNNKFNGNTLAMFDDGSGLSIFGGCLAYGAPKIDILMYESTGYKIYKNEFEFDGNITVSGNQHGVNHILIDGFDPYSSTIKWNKFKSFINSNINSSIVSGIIVDGLNPHLMITCNEFVDMGVDILVKGSSSIHGNQENPTNLNAYNKFSSLLLNRERLNNIASGSFINYTYDGVLSSIYDPLTLGVTRVNPASGETPNCSITNCEGYLVKIEVLNKEKPIFNLYPNPATNKINIFSNMIQMSLIRKLEIYNVEGKLILTKSYSDFETEYSIDLIDFHTGLYVLKMTDVNNLTYCEKFLIE